MTVWFKGYVKQIEQTINGDPYTITCSDELIRAIDFFIVPDSPDSSFTRQNIAAETLVSDVLGLAGSFSYDYQATSYTLAVNGTTAEVKLVSSYDYCKSIADLLAWSFWADRDGVVNFKNRKPYVMSGTSGQVGDVADTAVSGLLINDDVSTSNILSMQYRYHERDLRNKIVVWGNNGITSVASASSPYLPSGYYKTVLFSNTIIGSQDAADKTAEYNLTLLNRLTEEASVSLTGDYRYTARTAVNVDVALLSLDQVAYVYSVEHRWNKEGFISNLELRLWWILIFI